jgi:hypothetical protein
MKTIICKLSEARGGFRCWTGPSGQIAILAMLLWLPTTGAETWIIPNGAETRENLYNIGEPFSRPGNIISQQIFPSSLFPVISTPGEFLQLERIGFRLSTEGPDAISGSAFFDRVEILVSTGSGPFTSSLSENHGENLTIVYDQTLTLQGSGPPGSAPAPFDLEILFSHPFLYNPSEGSLVLEIRKYGAGRLPGLGGAEINGGRFYFDRGLGVETLGNIGLETSFSYQVIPEPRPAALLFLGGLSFAVLRWKEQD